MNIYEARWARDNSLNLGVAAIGAAGHTAICTMMRDPAYASAYFRLELQQDGAFRHDDACWMLVLADLGEEGALDEACACAEAFCREKRPADNIALVTMDHYAAAEYLHKAEAVFDRIFLVESVEQLHLPLVLFRNVGSEHGFVGVDFADITAIFERARLIHVTREIYPNMEQAISQTKGFLAKQAEKQKRFGCRYGDGWIIGAYDENVDLEAVEEAVMRRMADRAAEVMFHAVFNAQKDDPTETIIMFDCVREESRQKIVL